MCAAANCTLDKLVIPSKATFFSFPNWVTIDGDFSVRSQESKEIRFSPLRIVASRSLDSALVMCGYRKCNKVSYMLVITSSASFIVVNYEMHIKKTSKNLTPTVEGILILQCRDLDVHFSANLRKFRWTEQYCMSKNDV